MSLPTVQLHQRRLIISPDIVLRRHRDLLHAATRRTPPKHRPAHPRCHPSGRWYCASLTPDPENGVCRPGAESILVGVAVHPARRRQLLPPSPQEQARRAEETAAWRAERDRRDAERRPARLAAVCTGPPVRDPDAAADCPCSCHPKPTDAERHDGGLSCGCQLTAEERKRAWEEFAGQLDGLGVDAGIQYGEAELAQHAQELGVTAQWRLVAAPLVITGNIDGRGFYLRERHGSYRVTIAPDDDPAADPWELPAERATLDIADGEDDDLTGPDGCLDVARTLTVAVHAVRTFLARRECAHQRPADPRHLFCSWCGIRLAAADKWTSDDNA